MKEREGEVKGVRKEGIEEGINKYTTNWQGSPHHLQGRG